MNQSVKLILVGDVFLSNMDYTKGIGVGSFLLKKGTDIINTETVKALKDSDILFGNLESPLIDNIELVDAGCFAGSTSFTSILQEYGFDIVSIANNHILEQGNDGFISTMNALTEAQIKYVGVFNDTKSNIEIIECKGLKFGFAGFNAIKDIPNPNLHADLTFENVKATLDEMNSFNIDYKLLSFHWGNEYINIPSYDQINLAHSIIDYGADVIIGHHPHIIQPIERYKNGIIIYSLGNFIFDFLFSEVFKIGMKVELKFNKGSKIEYSTSEVRLNEITLNSIQESDQFNKKVEFYNNKMGAMLLHSAEYYNKYYNRTLKISRFYQRILMKVKLGKLLFYSSHKKLLFINISKQIFKYQEKHI